ncbi:hypothetical protein [Sciscionella sediminilitoris]|uniref:hypothetical protein n=1 Tax=Sciscionella sediminilitoris TaxID=1445613 RepID=UPI0004DF93F0|nr:hypothetical protein [Sciscionella sp. SE31]
MDGGTDIIGQTGDEHGRHSRAADRAGTSAWTPAVGRPAETPANYGRHAAQNVPAQRGPGTPMRGEDYLPNLRPSKHEAGPEPVPVLEPVEYDRPPKVDPLADTDSFGLRKFNLGSVPASVTPPRTWRRAAWFSVAASGAALTALVAVASAFVGKGERTTIDALPGLPSAPLATEQQPDQGTGKHALRETARTTERTGPDRRTTTMVDANHDGVFDTSVVNGPVAAGDPVSSANPDSASNGSGSSSGPTNSSSSTITAKPLPPPQENTEVEMAQPEWARAMAGDTTDPKQSDRVSRSYYDTVADNPSAALSAYAADSMSSAQRKAIKKRYADVQYIRVSYRYVDPNARTTTNTMKLYYKDGTVRVVRHTLTFTKGDHPKIISES